LALKKINKEIAGLEKKKENMEMELANPELYETPDKLKGISEAHGELTKALNELYNRWIEICEDIEGAKRS
jgi:protein subunit release factor A